MTWIKNLIARTLLFSLIAVWTNAAFANSPLKVVVTIPPFHALVSAVMGDIAKPQLLLKAGASPHHYTLRPSEIKALQEANLIFWGGPALESFLIKPFTTLPKSVKIIEFDKTKSLLLLPVRRTTHFEACCDHEHENGDNDKHSHSHTNSHTHSHSHAHSNHNKNDHAHDHPIYDMHFWLDPNNAKLIIDEIATTLSKSDPEHARQYQENAKQFKLKLTALDSELKKQLKPVQKIPFIVFHDAYQYFERHYNLSAAGSISLHPEIPPSVERLQEIRNIIQTTKAVCVFREPQFKSQLVTTLAQETGTHEGELDPLGLPTKQGGDGYLKLLKDLANAFVGCLGTKKPTQN